MQPTEISPSLGSEHRGHQAATSSNRSKLRGNDCAQGIVASNAHSSDETPNNEDADYVDSVSTTGESLCECASNDYHQLDTV
jgi:hypothetical protein